MAEPYDIELLVDLNTMDDTGLPWAFLDQAPDPGLIVAGAHIVVGSGAVRAVATVVDNDGEVVHVRPLRGAVSEHAHLLTSRRAS